MEAIFQLNSDELGTPLVEKIKALFAHETIRISVSPVENGNGMTDASKAGILAGELSDFFEIAPASFTRKCRGIRAGCSRVASDRQCRISS